MFDDKSRYANAATYSVIDGRGRRVTVVSVPDAPAQTIAGHHVLREGQRPDHLAFEYLDDPAGAWRVAEANGAMQIECLTEQREIAIPNKGK